MNAKILIYATLFLIGNITLTAQELNREGINFSENITQSFIRKGVADELKERLLNRGLDDEAAQDLVKNSFNENEILTFIKINNYLSAVEDIEYDTLMEHLATKVLFKKEINFESYDNLIGITRDLNPKVIKPQTLDKLSKVADINKNLYSV